jgi:steroid 5-alpha reductase family enzyme
MFFINLPFALLTAWAWTFLAFLVGRSVKRHATIDVFWGAGFLLVALESLLVSHWQSGHAVSPWWSIGHAPTFRFILLGAVALWSLRLSIHLGLRQRGSEEDSRYVAIMQGARGRHETVYALRMIYGLQGFLLWFVSIPVQWMAFSTSFNGLFIAGLVLVLIGVFFEATGDAQLRRFSLNPANSGTTLSTGLWRYTRHPNYFGDATVWTGFYLCACATPWGYLTILSPITMIWLLTSLSGKPMLEKKLTKTRQGYDHYVATTSSFFPWPPRKKER